MNIQSIGGWIIISLVVLGSAGCAQPAWLREVSTAWDGTKPASIPGTNATNGLRPSATSGSEPAATGVSTKAREIEDSLGIR